ncbi:MAG: hypothetical protein ABJE66_05045 [Deltaproteobacteria bacterium]
MQESSNFIITKTWNTPVMAWNAGVAPGRSVNNGSCHDRDDRSLSVSDQAARYVSDVRDRFKNDDRAKRCKQTSDGPLFEAAGELYPACRP